jgi:hypothetical protein
MKDSTLFVAAVIADRHQSTCASVLLLEGRIGDPDPSSNNLER